MLREDPWRDSGYPNYHVTERPKHDVPSTVPIKGPTALFALRRQWGRPNRPKVRPRKEVKIISRIGPHSLEVRSAKGLSELFPSKTEIGQVKRRKPPDYTKDFQTLEEMEWAFSKGRIDVFERVLGSKPSILLRIHSVCMLADMKNELAVPLLCKALREDPSPLVRHEGAFSLGQLGFKSAVPSLIESMADDESVLVRHESAVALGSIGDERAREGLETALDDMDEDVRLSAEVALADLDFLKRLRSRTES